MGAASPGVLTIESLADISETVNRAGRLSRDQILRLFRHSDLNAVGMLARQDRDRRFGMDVYYVRNRHVNYSNICSARCGFCAFGCDASDARAFALSPDEFARAARQAADDGCVELHAVGGLHPEWGLDRYVAMIAAARSAAPNIHLKCFSAVEIAHLARRERASLETVLCALMDAGLGSLPGGGAEIFSPRVRSLLCPDKPDADAWIAVHRTAHGMGLPSNATMLYGHVETIEERVDHLLRLRALQDETKGFLCFVPLAFHPENTRFADLSRVGLAEDLRVMAVSRLALDNIPHLKAYWPMLGIDGARLALRYGADDLDGTLGRERVFHAAGAKTPEALSEDDLEKHIRDAGFTPVMRDALHRPI